MSDGNGPIDEPPVRVVRDPRYCVDTSNSLMDLNKVLCFTWSFSKGNNPLTYVGHYYGQVGFNSNTCCMSLLDSKVMS